MQQQRQMAFLSYVRFDDDHENGYITRLSQYLTDEVRAQTGTEFVIFQDRKDIVWGQKWEEQIKKSIDEATFLIPIVTPSFFKSKTCRYEVKRFLMRETKLGRSDLILPIYYIACPVSEPEEKLDELARTVFARQYVDWRDLRFKSFDSVLVKKKISELASHIVQSIQRIAVATAVEPEGPAPQFVAGLHREAFQLGISIGAILEARFVLTHVYPESAFHLGNLPKFTQGARAEGCALGLAKETDELLKTLEGDDYIRTFYLTGWPRFSIILKRRKGRQAQKFFNLALCLQETAMVMGDIRNALEFGHEKPSLQQRILQHATHRIQDNLLPRAREAVSEIELPSTIVAEIVEGFEAAGNKEYRDMSDVDSVADGLSDLIVLISAEA